MASVKGQDGYCDFLFDELSDMKQRLDSAIGRTGDYSTAEAGRENVSAHLRDIENVIEAKIEILGKSCPDWQSFQEQRSSEGRFERVHTEGVPYGKTPM